MSWGDSWGHSPCNNARVLAKAFFEGRERTFGQSCVRFHDYETRIEYLYRGAVIARYTPPAMLPRLVAERLTKGRARAFTEWPLEFRCHFGDKGEARHLQALGVDAVWQHSKRPFLIFGVDANGMGWNSIDAWKTMDKWVELLPEPKPPRREPFINLTLPLFA